jgi:ABC-type multidrug transport system ATPase subunit
LDSFTSEQVMNTLKNLAKTSGRTVICTIHQPNSDIFHMFDQLMLLAKGRVVFYGKGKDAIQYFSDLGYDCPMNSNPSDFFSLVFIISLT